MDTFGRNGQRSEPVKVPVEAIDGTVAGLIDELYKETGYIGVMLWALNTIADAQARTNIRKMIHTIGREVFVDQATMESHMSQMKHLLMDMFMGRAGNPNDQRNQADK